MNIDCTRLVDEIKLELKDCLIESVAPVSSLDACVGRVIRKMEIFWVMCMDGCVEMD